MDLNMDQKRCERDCSRDTNPKMAFLVSFQGGIAAVTMILIIGYYRKQSKGETTPDVRYQRIDENDEEMGVMIPRNDETTDDEEEHDVWR